jgi:hypothetical protein
MGMAANRRLLFFAGFAVIAILLLVVVGIASTGGNTLPSQSPGVKLTAGKEYATDDFQPAFSFKVVGEGWYTAGPEFRDILDIKRPGGLTFGFLNVEEVFYPNNTRETDRMTAPKDMVAWFQRHPYLEAEEPEPVSIGGAKGVYFDVLVLDVPEGYHSICGAPALNLVSLSGGDVLCLPEAEKHRIIMLEDVEGETVTIMFGGPAVDFEEFLPKAQKVLDTVEWGGA